MQQAMQVLTSQETAEWYTPPDIIQRARYVLGGIDLDPCTAERPQAWIQALTWYGLMISPLLHERLDGADPNTRARLLRDISRQQLQVQPAWRGRVWLNPPFHDTAVWASRLEHDYAAGGIETAVLLVNSNLGYDWYERLWARWPVVCLRERLAFVREDGTTGGPAKRGQTLVYLGQRPHRFFDGFGDLGRCLRPE